MLLDVFIVFPFVHCLMGSARKAQEKVQEKFKKKVLMCEALILPKPTYHNLKYAILKISIPTYSK